MNDTAETYTTTEYTQNQCTAVVVHRRRAKTLLFFSKAFPNRTKQVLTVVVCFGDGQPNNTTKFKDMYDFIHVEEKWVYLMRDRQQFLLADEEIPPQCCVCHKGHITKIMFLCAVAQPSYDTSLKTWWDGKLSIWPVSNWEVVKQ